MITDDFEPANESQNLSLGTPPNYGVSAMLAKLTDNLHLTVNPFLTAAAKVDRFASPVAGIYHSMESLVKSSFEVMVSPVHGMYSDKIVNVPTQHMLGAYNGLTTLPTQPYHGLAIDFMTNGGLGKTLTIMDSITKNFNEASNVPSIKSQIDCTIGKTMMDLPTSGLTLDFASKYSTVNFASTITNPVWTHANKMFKATQPLTTLGNVTSKLISESAIMAIENDAMKSLTGYQLTLGKTISNFITPYSLSVKPEFDLLKGFGTGILEATVKADYLTKSKSGYLHIDNTFRLTPNFEDRLSAFGDKILARLDRGLYRSLETETEIIERDGKVEYHFHLHVNVTGNFNIIGHSNIQNNFISGHA